MGTFITFLIIAIMAFVIYAIQQRNSPARLHARRASEALRTGAFWDSAPPYRRKLILTCAGKSESFHNSFIAVPWTALNPFLRETIGSIMRDTYTLALREINGALEDVDRKVDEILRRDNPESSSLTSSTNEQPHRQKSPDDTIPPPGAKQNPAQFSVETEHGKELITPNSEPYLYAVCNLIVHLAKILPLPEWTSQCTAEYTREESEAIRISLDDYESIAEYILKEVSGGISPGQGIVNPEYAEPIKRFLAVRRLKQLADAAWTDTVMFGGVVKHGDIAPENWREIVSTYLKMWRASLNPFDILDAAEILSMAGYGDESKAAIKAALMFPLWAAKHPASKEEFLAVSILAANMLFISQPGLTWSVAYNGIMEGNYSENNLSALRHRAREIDQKQSKTTNPATHPDVLSSNGDRKSNTASVMVAKPDQARESEPNLADSHSDSAHGIDPDLLKRAEAGDANAQGIIGLLYSLGGNGVPRNDTQAAHWFRNAAERGHVLAQFQLAGLYQTGSGVSQDYEKAMFWYRKAAEQGHANAQLNLAFGYLRGRGANQDYAEGVAWMSKAAEQGDATAQYDLGLMYLKGEGVSPDPSRAADWFHKAAEQGYVDAYSFLGAQYAEGVGVLQSSSEAFFWLSVAAAIGKESERKGATKTRDLAAACLSPEENSVLLKRVVEWIESHPPKT